MSKETHRDDLRGTLRDAFEVMPSEAKATMRHRVLVSASYSAAPGRIKLAFARSAALFTTLAILMTGTSYAAANSVPGDALYPLKRAVEETHVALSLRGPEDALVEQTQTRAEEVRRLMEMDASEAIIDQAAIGFGDAAIRAIEHAQSPEEAARTVRKIQEGVSDQPAHVQQRVEDALPGSGGADAPKSPIEDAPGTQEPGSDSGSQSGSDQGSGSGSGESQGGKP